jgi:superfamily II DNA/RNA helicase
MKCGIHQSKTSNKATAKYSKFMSNKFKVLVASNVVVVVIPIIIIIIIIIF